MQINKLIIHEIRRLADANPLIEVKRASLNNLSLLSNETKNSLIKLFINAGLTIGGFGVDGNHDVQPPFEQNLITYHDSNTDQAFVDFTVHTSTRFATILNEPSKKTVKGGFLVFYEYEYLNNDWIAVVILNKTEGIDVNSDLDVFATQLLDLAKLHIGAIVNLTKWRAGDGERYIKFRTGLASEVRDYFERLVGCIRDQEAIKVETQKLRDTIEKFAFAEDFGIDNVNNILSEAFRYISPRLNNSQPVLLVELVNSIFPDRVDEFFEYINDNDIDLSDEIAIDKKMLATFKRYTARWNDVNLTFSRKAIGDSVAINDNDEIVLSNVPAELVEEIKKILNS